MIIWKFENHFPSPEHGQPMVSEDWLREVSPVPQLRREDENVEPPKGTKPWFIQTIPSEVSVHIGEPLTLDCIVDGDPKPVGRCLQPTHEFLYFQTYYIVLAEIHNFYLKFCIKPCTAI